MSSLNNVIKVSVFHGIIKYLINAMMFFFGVYFHQIGLSGTQIGLIFASGTIASILTALPSGFSNDSHQSKKLISISLLLLAGQYYAFTLTQEFLPTLIIFAIGGIGVKIFNTSMDSLFYKSAEKENLGPKISIFQTLNYVMIGLGIISAGALLGEDLNFHKIFIILAGLLLAMALASTFTLPNNATTSFELTAYKNELANKKVLLLVLIYLLFALHFGAENTSYGLFLKENLSLDGYNSGLYMGIALISMSFTTIVIGATLRKWQPANIMLLGLLVSGSGHIFMTLTDNPLLSFLFRAMHESGDAAFFFFVYFGITKLFSQERIGGTSSIITFTGLIGSAIGSMIFAPIGEIYGYHHPLIISGAVVLFAFVLGIIFFDQFKHEHN